MATQVVAEGQTTWESEVTAAGRVTLLQVSPPIVMAPESAMGRAVPLTTPLPMATHVDALGHVTWVSWVTVSPPGSVGVSTEGAAKLVVGLDTMYPAGP
jgi:hypothetical protein